MLFIIYLLSLDASALANECGPLDQIVKNIEIEWTSDNFDAETHVKKFWAIHQRFGFIRNEGKIYLIAKNSDIAEGVLKDFESIGFTSSFKKMESFRSIEGEVYDVTEALPEVLRSMHGKPLEHDGGNCWNFCLRELITKGSLPMSGEEFKHWMSSPLAEPILNYTDLRPGDIMAFRVKTNGTEVFDKSEVHGAMYLSPRLALAKSAMGRYYPYRILDLHEAVGYYYPNRSDYIQVFRLQSLSTAIAKLNSPSSGRLREWTSKAWQLEAESDAIFYGRKPNGERLSSSDKWKLIDQFETFGEKLRVAAKSELENFSNIPAGDIDRLTEKAIWEGLVFKANNYVKLQLVVD